MKFLAILMTLTALLGLVMAQNAQQLLADIKDIAKQAGNLRDSLQKTDGNDLQGALSIASSANLLDRAVQKATTEADNLNSLASDHDADEALKALQPTGPTVDAISARLIQLHDNLKKKGVANVAKTSINNNAQHTKAFSEALLKKTPKSKKAAARRLSSRINNALEKAVRAYDKD